MPVGIQGGACRLKILGCADSGGNICAGPRAHCRQGYRPSSITAVHSSIAVLINGTIFCVGNLICVCLNGNGSRTHNVGKTEPGRDYAEV